MQHNADVMPVLGEKMKRKEKGTCVSAENIFFLIATIDKGLAAAKGGFGSEKNATLRLRDEERARR